MLRLLIQRYWKRQGHTTPRIFFISVTFSGSRAHSCARMNFNVRKGNNKAGGSTHFDERWNAPGKVGTCCDETFPHCIRSRHLGRRSGFEGGYDEAYEPLGIVRGNFTLRCGRLTEDANMNMPSPWNIGVPWQPIRAPFTSTPHRTEKKSHL